MKLEPMLEKVE